MRRTRSGQKMNSWFLPYGKISLFSPSWMVKRIGETEYRKYFFNLEKEHRLGKLLDIGCGAGEKKTVIPSSAQYTGVDHSDCPHDRSGIDVFCSAYQLPFPEGSYDNVFCTGVLEHLEEPEKAIREAFRVLKPGGEALYAIPLFWHLHEEPRDFFRFTHYGINYLFAKAGFDLIETKALSGFWVTFGSEFNYYLNSFKRGIFRPFISLCTALNNLIFLILEKLHRNEKWTWMYLVIARKPENPTFPATR